ncbi:MAG: hypothetical protein AAGC92_04240 [Pseudomonadota bacterium]
MTDVTQEKIHARLAGFRDEALKLPAPEAMVAHLAQLVELRKNLVRLYELANRAEQRLIIENVSPNRMVTKTEIVFEP